MVVLIWYVYPVIDPNNIYSSGSYPDFAENHLLRSEKLDNIKSGLKKINGFSRGARLYGI
jgi:hypothetical protein